MSVVWLCVQIACLGSRIGRITLLTECPHTRHNPSMRQSQNLGSEAASASSVGHLRSPPAWQIAVLAVQCVGDTSWGVCGGVCVRAISARPAPEERGLSSPRRAVRPTDFIRLAASFTPAQPRSFIPGKARRRGGEAHNQPQPQQRDGEGQVHGARCAGHGA